MGKPRNNKQKGGKSLPAKAIKDGQIKKNKAPPAFKPMPKETLALVNVNKNGNVNVHKKQLGKQSNAQQNSINKKQNNKNPKINLLAKESPQKPKKNNKAIKQAAEEESDSDEDINEGISITEQVSVIGEDDDDSSDEDSTPNILGASLAEDSDDDDEDFEADSDEEVENKGVKMFKGILSANDDDEDDDDEDEDDDENEDDDDDEDDEDEDEEENDISANITASTMNTSGDSLLTMDSSEDDDDEDDEDDEDDDEDEDESPGLKALLGHSLVDDDDDEDFNDDEEDEDDDDDEIDDSEEDEDDNEPQSKLNLSNISTSSEGGKVRLSPEEKAERDRRTIYIGNVPKEMQESRLKQVFGKFGKIESIRVRGVVPDSPKLSYKVAKIKNRIHDKVTCICVFVIYKSETSAKAALTLNGTKLEGNYLRVDLANQNREYDTKKTIFIGNLPFDLEDNEIWELFGKCGTIEYVRTVRDRRTGTTRGIGYVCFKTEDSVALALDLNGTVLRKREMRVARYSPSTEKKPRKEIGGKKRPMQGNGNNPAYKKVKTDGGKAAVSVHNAERRVNYKQKRSQGQNQRSPNANGRNERKGSFQGQKAGAKKSGKSFNKFEKKKKAMAGKLMAKSKKPVA